MIIPCPACGGQGRWFVRMREHCRVTGALLDYWEICDLCGGRRVMPAREIELPLVIEAAIATGGGVHRPPHRNRTRIPKWLS